MYTVPINKRVTNIYSSTSIDTHYTSAPFPYYSTSLLCENSFHYVVGTFPVGKGFDAAELQRSFMKVFKAAQAACINLVSLVGDGDTRLMQYDMAATRYRVPFISGSIPFHQGNSDARCVTSDEENEEQCKISYNKTAAPL